MILKIFHQSDLTYEDDKFLCHLFAAKLVVVHLVFTKIVSVNVVLAIVMCAKLSPTNIVSASICCANVGYDGNSTDCKRSLSKCRVSECD